MLFLRLFQLLSFFYCLNGNDVYTFNNKDIYMDMDPDREYMNMDMDMAESAMPQVL